MSAAIPSAESIRSKLAGLNKRQILGEWVEREVHRSSVVMRVWHGNGNGGESDRSCAGCSPELARVRSGRGSA